MSSKKIVAIIFGGRSAEHEISIQSAKNILEAIDTNIFSPLLIGICRNGQWCHIPTKTHLQGVTTLDRAPSFGEPITLFSGADNNILFLNSSKKSRIDIVFPILHGPMGEDGSIQGLFRIYNIPFVGCDVLGSAIGMDKDIMKRLFQIENLPIGKYQVLYKHHKNNDYQKLVKKIGEPFFIKPANMGSSVGVHKIHSENEFNEKLGNAFLFDHKVIAEEFISGREIECAVLGNTYDQSPPQVSGVGEITTQQDFYSYEAKYINNQDAFLSIPPQLDDSLIQEIQSMSLRAFKCLELSGLSRVDFFLSEKKEIYINEVNTMPGFTNISMYPKLWEQEGLSYTQLITNLLQLAVDKFKNSSTLKNIVK